MKTRKTLLTLLGISLSAISFGQATDFGVYASDSLPTCSNGISISVSAGAIQENDGIIYINWGDGTTEQVPFVTEPWATQGYYYGYSQHTYAASGYYTGNVQVWSGMTNSYVGTQQSFTLLAGDPNSCGYVHAYTYSDVQSIYVYDIPLDFTGADGSTFTSTPASYSYGYYTGLNPANGPYTASLNDAWLAAHNYVQTSADQQVTTFDGNGFGGQIGFEVSCGSALVDADIEIQYMWGSFVAPTQTGSLAMRVCNVACSGPQDTEIELSLENFLVPDLTGLSNASLNNNVLTFEIDDLQGCIDVTIPFTFPGTTAGGTPLTFTATATAIGGGTDPTPGNNNYTLDTQVWNSYDPNNKLVDKSHYIDYHTDEKLQYLINFQNEGNYPALNITVKDTISANLDLSTFRLVETSHTATYTIDAATRVVTFKFPVINLQPVSENEAASKGSIVYSIEEMPGLPLNSEIKNTAYIYFDFNPAIITNTTSNINSMLAVQQIEMEQMSIYPNPASGKITIDAKGIQSVKITDLAGKTVLDQPTSGAVNVASLPAGIYMVHATTETGNAQQKLVIQH